MCIAGAHLTFLLLLASFLEETAAVWAHLKDELDSDEPDSRHLGTFATEVASLNIVGDPEASRGITVTNHSFQRPTPPSWIGDSFDLSFRAFDGTSRERLELCRG